ncbi:tetratricopeptide repeat-containing sensor histidine kinase [Dysgonomonas sp. ZJ709]|uniref:tetratricopeptide repeat-containing sensor histidine kinase n=1 Tax=Dysgonomonas sp. ZJ709 TaxID=2709797 RepID=UPI0013EC3DD2|nr:tetratricopeptide repeat-containing sensor histidine kinase [Dysgonomonas sp. ZJ709]
MNHIIRKFILFTIIVFTFNTSNAQNSINESIILNNNGLTYDSLISVISNNKILFSDKFKLVKEIDDISAVHKINEIYEKILSEAKNQKEKKYTIDLYCSLANNYLVLNNLDKAKLYLDSAQTYENKTDSISSKALLSFITGRYYAIMKREDEANKYFHKSISFYEQIKGKESTAILLLYSLAAGYYDHGDIDGLKKIKDKMTYLAKIVNEPPSYTSTYAVTIAYYELMYKETAENHYQDSITLYNEKTINIFDNADKSTKNMLRSQIIQNYLNVAEAKLNQENPDWRQVKEYAAIASEILEHKDLNHIGLIDNKVILYRLKSKIFLHEKNYKEANKEAQKALAIMDSGQIGKDFSLYSSIYLLLINTYEEMGDYKMALKYYKLKDEINDEIDKEKRFATIKDLETKYETAKKDLEISHLNEERQQMQYNRAIMIACFITIAILLIIALLYNRLRRLQKEKEVIQMNKRIEERDFEYQTLLNETQFKLAEQYISGLEGERIRLGKELHDGTANDLLAIILQIENNGNKEITVNLLKDVYADVRNISHNLVPPLMSNVTFADILIDFIRVKNKHSMVNFQLQLTPEDQWESLPADLATETYRIIQEAVSNMMKHSKSSVCNITVTRIDSTVTVQIIDNGKGFDLNKKNKGLGLRIMEERAKYMNANIEINSKIGKGTEVKLTFDISSIS